MSEQLSAALGILKNVAAHCRRWGKHASLKDFSSIDLTAAIITADDAGVFEAGYQDLKEQLTLARRQLAAANARTARADKYANNGDVQ
jgi:hypothetical protein